jgi:hypothetical protein
MTTAGTITTQADWEALPVGMLDDGKEVDGGTATVFRVDGHFPATPASTCTFAADTVAETSSNVVTIIR